MNLCTKAYNSDHVILFQNMSKILVHRRPWRDSKLWLVCDLVGGKIVDMEWEICEIVSLCAKPLEQESFAKKIDAMEGIIACMWNALFTHWATRRRFGGWGNWFWWCRNVHQWDARSLRSNNRCLQEITKQKHLQRGSGVEPAKHPPKVKSENAFTTLEC